VSLDQLRALLLIAVTANLGLFVLLAAPALLGRRSLFGAEDPDLGGPPEPADIALDIATAEGDVPPELAAGLAGPTYERAVRVVSYGFLLASAAAVALSGAWPDTASAIYVLLGLAALFVLVVHDMLPSRVLGAGKFVLEGLVAIGVVTLLVALTGGASSPFVLGYFLIAGGAALVVDARANLLLAAAISIVYVATVALLPETSQLQAGQAAALAVVLVAFWLFSYLASVVARAQRATRDAAIRLSLHDPLTRLNNRSYLFAVMEREIQRARRTGRSFGLLLLDLDGLKPINDTFGHPMGDRVLRAVGEAIRHGIRGIDTGARYGGDEFVVLLPETDLAGAVTVAEKLREAIGTIRVSSDEQQVRATVSVGVASFPDDGSTPQALLERADAAMFGSKRGGRDRVSAGPATTGPAPTPTVEAAPRPVMDAPSRPLVALGAPAPAAVLRPAPLPVHARAYDLAAPGRVGVSAAQPMRFGGTRADSVLAVLSDRSAATRRTSMASSATPAAAGAPGGAGTRAATSVAAPAVSAAPRGKGRGTAARPRQRSVDDATSRAAGGPRGASEPDQPAGTSSRRRARRFEIVPQHDDAQFDRTMRRFIGEPSARPTAHPPAHQEPGHPVDERSA